jgi:acyl-CoA hydrolase
MQVVAENPITGECTHTNMAYLVYVALDDQESRLPRPFLKRRATPADGRRQSGRHTAWRKTGEIAKWLKLPKLPNDDHRPG